MIKHPGGNQAGSPIVLKDFMLDTDVSITLADGDTGIDIGYSIPWSGRGDVRNILILNQWDGFKWKGGTVNPISNIHAYDCKGDGFQGINPRGELWGCLAQFNEGNGYSIFAESAGETGVRLIHCGTFANQEFGLILDTGPGVQGANVWTDKFSSSFDGRGGFYCDKDYIQVYNHDMFVEWTGFATNFKPGFTVYNDSIGIAMPGLNGRLANSSFSGTTNVLNCKGDGVSLGKTEHVIFDNLISHGNGHGLIDQRGLAIGALNVGLGITKFSSGAVSAQQLEDIAVNANDNTGQIGNVQCSSIAEVAPNATLEWVGKVTGIPAVSLAAVSVPIIPAYADFIDITGNAVINSLFPSWRGRAITLKFSGTATVADGNALSLAGPFNATPGDILRLECDGTLWNEISRSVN
jgi:hypothetical protein